MKVSHAPEKCPEKCSTVAAAAFGIAILVLGLGGCSLFSTRTDSAPADPSFHAAASADAMPTVLPVEIADDIKKIAHGEAPSPGEGWQKTPPAAPEAAEQGSEEAQNEQSEKQSKVRSPASEPGRISFTIEGENRIYKTKSGDTLMKIAFEAYGNLYRWREIYEANKAKIADFNAVPVGTVLTIAGVEYVKIERNGKPYLIRRHDTLTKISNNLYGKTEYWKSLWANNKMMIHDPNKIYSGFTLYYPENPKP